MHELHPDRSPITAAIFRVLGEADGPLTEIQIMRLVACNLPRESERNICYVLGLLAGADRLIRIVNYRPLSHNVNVVDTMYQLKNPLDGLASL